MRSRRARFPLSPALVAALAVAAGAFAALALAAPPGTNALVSRPAGFGALTAPIANDSSVGGGGQGISDGSARTVSDAGAGRFVAFVSSADGLSDADDDRVANVYLRDRQTDETILVSRADGQAGAGANADAGQPSISQDGRLVAFSTAATNLVPGAADGRSHVYVRDVVAGTTTLVDRADGQAGAIADGSSLDPSITVVGGQPVVTFSSSATNLDGAIPEFTRQVYVRDGLDTAMVSRRDAATPPNASAPGNGLSSNPSISSDGTAVAFQSTATDLVDGDTNGVTDVFARLRTTGATTLVSRNLLVVANGESTDPSISADGNRVAFTSEATNLVLVGDADTARDVYARDLTSGAVTLASRADGVAGDKGNARSSEAAISDDGSSVVFSSDATNLVPDDTNAASDVFIRSGLLAATQTTAIVSRPAAGQGADGPSSTPSMARAATGGVRAVAFTTAADAMGPDDDNDFSQVYVQAVGDGSIAAAALVSRPSGTAPFRGGVNHSSLRPRIRASEPVASVSADGRYTVFLSDSDELGTDDDDRFTNVFRRDNLSGETVLVSRADGSAGAPANGTSAIAGPAPEGSPSGAPAISADGNRISFSSAATNLVAGDANGLPDVFVRDVAAGTTVRASLRSDGSEVPQTSGDPAISADGNRVAFVTPFAIDAGHDANARSDVYVRDLAAATTTLVSRLTGGAAGNDNSFGPALDADGSVVAFESAATDLAAGLFDLNTSTDTFVHDLSSGQTRLVSIDATGTAAGNGRSVAPAVSADGARIAFASAAANLVAAGDANGPLSDVFVRDLAGNTTSLVSATPGAVSGNGSSERPSISADGIRIAFETFATDIVSPDANGTLDVLVRDTAAGATERASVATGAAGAQLAEGGDTPSISGDGSCVAFETRSQGAADLPPGSDFSRVVIRALRGDCPFGPVVQPPPPPGPGPGQQPGPPPQTGPQPAPNVRPTITGLRIAPARFLAGPRRQGATRRRPAVGGVLRFTLSERARVTIRIELLRPGRRLGARCVPPRQNLRRACVRAIVRGTLLRPDRRRGANAIVLTGRVGRRLLAPGSYRVTVRARDAGGLLSAPRTVRFSILAPRR